MGASSRLVQNDLFSFVLERSGGGVKGTSKPCPSLEGSVWGYPQLPTLEFSAALANSISCLLSLPHILNSASSHTGEAPHCVLRGGGVAAITREEAREHVPGPADAGIFLDWLHSTSGLAPSADCPSKRRRRLFLPTSEHMLLPLKVPRQEFAVIVFFCHRALLTLKLKCHVGRSSCWLICSW